MTLKTRIYGQYNPKWQITFQEYRRIFQQTTQQSFSSSSGPKKLSFGIWKDVHFFKKYIYFVGGMQGDFCQNYNVHFTVQPKLTMNNEPPASGQSYEACLSIDKLSIKHNCNRCQMLYNSYHTLGTH